MAALALGLACVTAGAQDITLTLRTDRPELVMGEPLLVEVTVLNTSDQDVLIRTDADAVSEMETGFKCTTQASRPTSGLGALLDGRQRTVTLISSARSQPGSRPRRRTL
jgi:hypothetical protein